jgi:hypothetical protein
MTILSKIDKREGKKKDCPMLEESPQRTRMAAGVGKPRPFSGNLILVGVLEHFQQALKNYQFRAGRLILVLQQMLQSVL